MRLDPNLESYRVIVGEYASLPNASYGMFDKVPGPCGERLTIMVDDGRESGWEHVSVSTRRRIPNWTEMCWVKDNCWPSEVCVVQFHPPVSKYVNNYSVVLHMWHWLGGEFVMPPEILVGFKELGELA